MSITDTCLSINIFPNETHSEDPFIYYLIMAGGWGGGWMGRLQHFLSFGTKSNFFLHAPPICSLYFISHFVYPCSLKDIQHMWWICTIVHQQSPPIVILMMVKKQMLLHSLSKERFSWGRRSWNCFSLEKGAIKQWSESWWTQISLGACQGDQLVIYYDKNMRCTKISNFFLNFEKGAVKWILVNLNRSLNAILIN